MLLNQNQHSDAEGAKYATYLSRNSFYWVVLMDCCGWSESLKSYKTYMHAVSVSFLKYVTYVTL